MSATSAAIADLCGEYEDRPVRPAVAEVLRRAAPGTVVAASEGGRPVALVVLADRRAFVVDDRCPHDGIAAQQGEVGLGGAGLGAAGGKVHGVGDER